MASEVTHKPTMQGQLTDFESINSSLSHAEVTSTKRDMVAFVPHGPYSNTSERWFSPVLPLLADPILFPIGSYHGGGVFLVLCHKSMMGIPGLQWEQGRTSFHAHSSVGRKASLCVSRHTHSGKNSSLHTSKHKHVNLGSASMVMVINGNSGYPPNNLKILINEWTRCGSTVSCI